MVEAVVVGDMVEAGAIAADAAVAEAAGDVGRVRLLDVAKGACGRPLLFLVGWCAMSAVEPIQGGIGEGLSSTEIEMREVEYRAGDRVLLSRLDLAVRQGETLMLLGRSGSGKTTCLKLINRLLEPTAGRVCVQGRDAAGWDVIQLRRQIGYAIQDVGLFPHYTVWKNVALVPTLERWEPPRIKQRVEEVLRLVGLPAGEFGGRYPRQLSGGQRQRVGLARALAADPPILLMDEPFGALDPLTRAEVQQEFRQLQRRMNKTVVFVTHDVGEALMLGDRIALMESGRLKTVETPESFLRSADEIARKYVEVYEAGKTEGRTN